MIQTRRSDRNLCADLLKVQWQEDSGEVREEYAGLEDISARGACLQLEEAIPEDAKVTILYPGGKYVGKVKYCAYQEGSYFVGVEFSRGYKWSAQQYSPAHLLEVRVPDGTES